MENTEVAQATEQTATTRKPRAKSAPQDVFCLAWNHATSRQDAIQRLSDAGYPTSYTALVARQKALSAKGVHLKDMPAAQRGRKTDVAALNAVLDAAQTPAS